MAWMYGRATNTSVESLLQAFKVCKHVFAMAGFGFDFPFHFALYVGNRPECVLFLFRMETPVIYWHLAVVHGERTQARQPRS
jgi:hypothetical protein